MQCGVRFSAKPSSDLRLTLALTGVYPPSDQQYSQFKDRELTPWLYEVPSEILRNGAVRYQTALSRYQQRLAQSAIEVFIGEDLKIKNMVKAPTPKMAINAETGEIATGSNGAVKYQKNGRRAKAGLAKSILASCWGRTWTYLQYKARRKGKLTIKVPPHHSSQECTACGHTHPENRPDQETFRCMSCGHTDNADHNAAKVLKKRGIGMLLNGEIKAPRRRKTMRMAKRKQVGQDMSEPAEAILPKLETAVPVPEPQIIAEETNVSREMGTTRFALWSTKRETSATRPQGV